MGTQYDLLAMPINVHLFHDLYRGSTIQFDDKLDCPPFYHNFWSATQKYNKIHAICIHQEMGNENEIQSNQRFRNKESKNRRIKDQSTKEPRKQRIKGPKKHTATTESKNSKQKKKTKTTRR